MKAAFLLRIRVISGLILVVALLLSVRLYFVQIVHGEAFSARAENQYVKAVHDVYNRGTIFFAGKDVRAATLKSGFTVVAHPDEIEDAAAAYAALAEVIELDRDAFFFRAGKTGDPYEAVAHRVSEEAGERIARLEIPGVRVYRDTWRYYPGGELAAQTIGFTAYDHNELIGRYGLERYYEDTLNREQNDLYVNFFAEIFANLKRTLVEGGDSFSGNVVTSLDFEVQTALEAKLDEIREQWGSTMAAGVVIDPRSGDIVALGSKPGFNLNTFGAVENTDYYANPLVERVYEMGSILKPVTMAAGLDADVVTPRTTYTDRGFVTIAGATISNYDGEGRGENVSMQDVLNESLNTGAVFVAERLGNERFGDYLDRFRIGLETGIDLPAEVPGLMGNLESGRDVEFATASFGQGIALTPIATVRALSALANGGTLITPHVAQEIEYETGFSKDVSFPEGRRVLDEETSETITRMLVQTVDEALLGGEVALPGYSIAAKTGTAQIPDPEGGGYHDDRYLHSFFGYFPAYDPQFLVFLMHAEPRGVRYASQTLTHPFMDMVQFLINHFDVAPDRHTDAPPETEAGE